MNTNALLPLCVLFAAALFFPSLLSADAKAANWRGQSVTEFSADENAAMDWQIVNDGVMGGLSEGRMDFLDEGVFRFSGNLSLENNGGFTTARSGEVDLNLSNDLGLLLRVRGDGRTYEARLDSDARFRGNAVSFAGKFETRPGEWIQVKIPFSDFEGSFRGMELPDLSLNPAAIERVWILLADKKSGPFELEIDYIRTFGKGQGKLTKRSDTRETATSTQSESGEKSLIDTAVADGRFTILKKALDTAGLTTFFQWDNPLTVFAPTDEAFQKLPEGTLEELLQPENKQKLIKILSYHVVAGSQDVATALQGEPLKTVEGSPLEIAFAAGRVKVNEAVMLDGDLKASDGLIHVIDSVLLPPTQEEDKSVIGVANSAGSFSTLLAAVETAGLTSVLQGNGPFTVLAPSDEAFAKLPEGTVDSLLKKENREQLTAILKNHVFSGKISAGDALNAKEAPTLAGSKIQFQIEEGRFQANDANIVSAGVEASNGIIHVIDSVLIPSAD